MAERSKYSILVLCALSALVLSVYNVLFSRFTIDDAYISYRYAENFASGQGLVFNAGERVEGYSNFLWVLVLGLLKKAGVGVPPAASVLGFLSLAAALIAVFKLVKRITGDTLCATGALALAATSFGLVFFSLTGLETVFYAALLTWAVYLFFRNDSRVSIGTAVVLAAAALTRPEGAMFFPLMAIFELVKHRRVSRRLAGAAGVFAVLFGAFLLWRHQYYGYWLPNTYYAKPPKVSAVLPPVVSGFDDIHRFFTVNGGSIFLVSALLFFLNRETRKTLYPLLPILAGIFAFQLYSGGDWMDSYRFLVPMLPVYLAAGAAALRWLLLHLELGRAAVLFTAVVTLLCLFNVGEAAVFYLKGEKYPNFVMTSTDLVPAARWVGDNYPPEYTIVCLRIGALAYFSKLNLIDADWGLTDEFVAHVRHRGEMNDAVIDEYLGRRNPELFMEVANRDARLEDAIVRGGRTYKLVRHFKQGSEQWWVLYEREDLSRPAG